MRKVIIYGMGHDFHEHYEHIRLMEQRGEIEILGISDKTVTEEGEHGGLRVVPSSSITQIPFEYLFVTSRKYSDEITDELVNERGIDRARIVPFDFFSMPGMTLELREKLNARRWSIVCNNCFGGILSHQFGLEHRSPFKNLFVYQEDLIRYVENITHYLAQSPVFDRWEQAKTAYDEDRYPVLRLDDILFFCNHDIDSDAAIADFERRAAKVDPERLMLIMITDSREVERAFQERTFGCPKLCISSVREHAPKTLYIEADNYLDLQSRANEIPNNPAYCDFLVSLLLGSEEFNG